MSLIPLLKLRIIIQTEHSATIGKKIAPRATIPKAPAPDFNNFKQPCTVPNASLSAPPTIGTHVSIVNFAASVFKLSAEDVTKF